MKTFKNGDRVINSIGKHGTVVTVTDENDHFSFIAKSGMVPVHIDDTPADEHFLHHAEDLTAENQKENDK